MLTSQSFQPLPDQCSGHFHFVQTNSQSDASNKHDKFWHKMKFLFKKRHFTRWSVLNYLLNKNILIHFCHFLHIFRFWGICIFRHGSHGMYTKLLIIGPLLTNFLKVYYVIWRRRRERLIDRDFMGHTRLTYALNPWAENWILLQRVYQT